ncbi:hypothetical protein [Pelagibius sp. Alg239-R121]|uniref:HD domain-containing protein n=1 Tax=Pelagibius sp. Alg239-R121 TaxID=2993448 RepID=UPI0024A68014|nr:hypothetical protein [Pelagibius sp. Alg239-R121]
MTNGLVPAEIIDDLKVRHAEVHRHYHTWAHIEALLKWLEEIVGQINDPHAVELAVLFHDAIYDPHSADNEVQSAALLMSELEDLVPDATLERANRLVLATAGHRLPSSSDDLLVSDCAFFLDMDLSVLGTSSAVFDVYEEAISMEYRFVPPDDYRKGRSAILQGFLDRDRLYFTSYFHDLLEQQARSNLRRSIERLKRA